MVSREIKMPVGRDEWDAGRKWETLEARILVFLKANRGQGFKIWEIYQGLGYRTQSGLGGIILGAANLWVIENALESLVKEGSVKAKIVKEAIGEDTYYMAT